MVGIFVLQVPHPGFNSDLAENFFHVENISRAHISFLADPCMPSDQCAKHASALLLCFLTTSTWTQQLLPAHMSC